MFDKLFAQIKDDAIEIMKQQPAIPADKTELAADQAIAAISDEVDKVFDSGDFSQLAAFKGDSASNEDNPILKNITQKFVHNMTANAVTDNATAEGISAEVIPALFLRLKSKFDSGSFDVKTLMSSLSLTDMMKLMGNMGKLKEVFGK